MSEFWCWHEGCPDCGKKSRRIIVLKERYGKNNMALLAVRLADIVSLSASMDEVLRALTLLPRRVAFAEQLESKVMRRMRSA